MSKEATNKFLSYRLLCSQCGDKSAILEIDRGDLNESLMMNEIIRALMQQLNETTIPNHKNHEYQFKEIRITDKINA